MSGDFDDDDGFDVFASGDEASQEDRPLGLVVPHRARVILDAKGAIIWEENSENERAFRAAGRPRILFEEEDPGEMDPAAVGLGSRRAGQP
ncbi:hypothetical protein [Bradyrhizobium sp. Ash2021]|uniref:hypothetical protein n=1 Tax=Bradyrhizobium sp. Ash2021 TaxID=2954771 RepID=UPI002814D764|nr:hypothetical protein [Bradyrhizobium sp. Ash2021]WMT75075.1 hypothetical protein NL528_01125 [Bradyrhizobium sp. Ash2021]